MKKTGVLAIAGLALAGLVWVVFGWQQSPAPSAQRQESPGSASRGSDQGASAAAAAGRYAAAITIARNTPDPHNPLVAYVPKPGIAGRNELDRIFAQGVPLTTQSALAARALLQRGLSDDEKIALARILARLYAPDDPTGYNAELLLDLRGLMADANKQVARSAVLSFSRLGYLPGSDAVLKDAFDKKILGPDDYYGELAHMAPLAPARVQDELLSTVRASSNAYAADILAHAINDNPKVLTSYSAHALGEIIELLGRTEPRFPPATGEFGLTDAVRYANWLRATAQLENRIHGIDPERAIVDRLGLPGTDPRKITAYLLTSEAAPLLAGARLGSPASSLVAVSNQYAAQHPGNRSLQAAAQEIAQRSARAKGTGR
jgi:hypothetical protein